MKEIEEFYKDSPIKAKTRKRILFAARELFSEFGIDGVTMLQIAEKAKITARNLYRYYSGKDLLIFDVAYLVFNKSTDIADITFDEKETGFESLKNLLYTIYNEQSAILFDIQTMKFLMYFDLYMLNNSSSEVCKKFETEYVFSMNDKIKGYLSEVMIKGLKDGTIDIPIRQLDFYLEFILQTFVSIIMRVTIKESVNKKFSRSFMEKQIEMLLAYVEAKGEVQPSFQMIEG